MWEQIKTNPTRWHFLAYCISFLGYGALLTGLGPLIPYLAQEQHNNQTQYSFFFLARTIGFVVGALLTKILEKIFSFHNILIIFSTLIFVSFGVFSYEYDMHRQGIYVFLGSVFSAITEIFLNVSVLTSQKGQHQQFYMQIAHGMFGVGGFISPFVVLFFQYKSYLALSLIMILIVPAYYLLYTPQKANKQRAQQIFEAGNLVDQLKRIQHRISGKSQKQSLSKQKKNTVVYLICFLVAIYIGQEVGFGSWISSYAVMEGISTKQQAVSYSSVFFAFITILRFVLAFVSLRPSQKLKILIVLQIIFSVMIIVLVQVFGILKFAAYFSAVTYGISFSAMFGLFFILPAEHNIQVTTQQSSSFLLYGQMGQGLIGTLVGYSMSWFSPGMIYYWMLFCGILLYWASQKIQYVLAQDQTPNPNNKQLNQINKKLNSSSRPNQLKQKLISKN